jgi:hypothetical protein
MKTMEAEQSTNGALSKYRVIIPRYLQYLNCVRVEFSTQQSQSVSRVKRASPRSMGPFEEALTCMWVGMVHVVVELARAPV